MAEAERYTEEQFRAVGEAARGARTGVLTSLVEEGPGHTPLHSVTTPRRAQMT
jgi:hypothetical protein